MAQPRPARSLYSLAPVLAVSLALAAAPVTAQETDITLAPNPIGAGIQRSYQEQIGTGQGNPTTPDSSIFIITRDPFRSIARGRQLFQRKFTRGEGHGPRVNDGVGNIAQNGAIGAGFADSCAGCHARPRGSAGFGGDVFTRPDSRDAPHLFGLGLVEMLADEITHDLREAQSHAVRAARRFGRPISLPLRSKGIGYGRIRAMPDGRVDTSGVKGVNPDLRVRPFFAEGTTISMREFMVGAFNAEMGLQAVDPILAAAAAGNDVTTPSGMRLSGSIDRIEAPPTNGPLHDPDGDGVVHEVPASIVDHLEFYLLNYFKPGRGERTFTTHYGQELMAKVGCTSCHVPDLVIEHDRRVADVETAFDADEPGFNRLFATAMPLFSEVPDRTGFPPQKLPLGGRFVVRGIFADFKRHDLGPSFHERNFDGTMQTEFMTEPLWGVGSTSPYGHDGRSINLREVILRHGGEADWSRKRFADLHRPAQDAIIEFLSSLVLFPPPDTASNLDPADPMAAGFPQRGHGSIKLSVLFNNPGVPE